ncbi:MAG: hypothetical protein IIX18_00360 [Clostridia bacterium]|nr:hypothetical protein [Clostridia bacterium]MBQ6613752.1 hypothetical protein [Clostridia bacterium]
MNIDKNMLNALASLDDASLAAAIKMIAASGGVDIGSVKLDSSSLASLRSAMLGASDRDIEEIKKVFDSYKGKK